jgi:hypothetical protein
MGRMDEIQQVQIEARKLVYQQCNDHMRAAFQLQGDYGKWLIASLLLIHGVAIWFVAESTELSRTVLPSVFWWHVAGILFALLCGLFTWGNWSLHSVLYEPLDPGMIVDAQHWPRANPRTEAWITVTYWLSVIIGLLSAGCILGAAVVAYCRIAQ